MDLQSTPRNTIADNGRQNARSKIKAPLLKIINHIAANRIHTCQNTHPAIVNTGPLPFRVKKNNAPATISGAEPKHAQKMGETGKSEDDWRRSVTRKEF